jgi:adenine/guanine/hypoxanthine permease
MKLIPRSVKLATIVGMGLQIALVGMTSVKLVVPNVQTIVGLGDIHSPDISLAILGLVLIGSLLFHQVRGGILIGIFVMTLIDWVKNDHYPSTFIQVPDFNIDVTQFIGFNDFELSKCMAGIMAFLFIGVIDVSGVIFGMASLAKLTEADGTIQGATPTFVSVALSTLVSAATGGTPVIVYVESAAGIKEGGRTGLTAVLISFYFLLALFFAPILSEVRVFSFILKGDVLPVFSTKYIYYSLPFL